MKSLLALIFGITVSLLLGEAGIRLYLHLAKVKDHRSLTPIFYYAPANSDSLINYPTKSNVIFKIAAIGDSFTFPHAMQFDDCYSKRLERMLNLNGGGAVVTNYGVAGYSTREEVQLAKKALSDGAKLIILQITLNDPEFEHMSRLAMLHPEKYTFGRFNRNEHPIIKHSRLLTFILKRIHNKKTWDSYIKYHRELFAGKTWKSFAASVRKIHNLTKKKGATLVALIFPLFAFPFDAHYPMVDIHEKLHSFLKKEGIQYLDLLGAFWHMPHERLTIDPRKDTHPNELAHRIAAEHLYLWLESNNLIPESLKIKKKFGSRPSRGKLKPVNRDKIEKLLKHDLFNPKHGKKT
ncbi:MAG: SGNH/GDSL hydrolase family protein [Candidatus Dadabacteria bacterium]|nr:MAG: SGNH/GDSL hydrolase family protein [Candidatus Dadabacteria bacterium]